MDIEPVRLEAALDAIKGEKQEFSQRDEPRDEPLLTPLELRERLRVSAVTVWRMKGLPFILVGARKRYLWSEVQQYLAEVQAQ